MKDWRSLPWATLMAVVFSIIAGIVALIEPNELSFDEYTTQVVVIWSFLAVGRGLSSKEDKRIKLTPFASLMNTLPWATIVTGIVAVVGYIGVITSDSLTFQELGTKLAVLIGALGLGRGLGEYKKDNIDANLELRS